MKHDVLGEIIKQARIKHNLSQEQFAEIINCSPRHLIAIENEYKKPGYWLLYKIIRELEISPNTIFYPEIAESRSEKDELIDLIKLCDERTIKILSAAAKESLKFKD